MSKINEFSLLFVALIHEIQNVFEANNRSIVEFEPIKKQIFERNKGKKSYDISDEEGNFFIKQTLQLQAGVSKLGSFFQTNEEQLLENYEALQNVYDEINGKDKSIAASTAESEIKQQELSKNQEELKASLAKNAVIESKNLELTTTIKEIQRKIEKVSSESQTQIKTLEDKNKSDLAQLTAKLKEANAQNKPIKAQLFATSQELDSLKTSQQSLQASSTGKIKELEAQIETSAQAMLKLTAENGKLEELKTSNSALTSKLNDLTTEQTRLLEEKDKNKALADACEEDRERLNGLNKRLGKYIENINPGHFTGETLKPFSLDTQKYKQHLSQDDEVKRSPGGGGKRRKRTLRKIIIRRR